MRLYHSVMLAACLTMASPAVPAIPDVGSTARGNIFYLSNGQKLAVDDLKGMVVVVTYWAEDCKSCDDQVKLIDYYVGKLGNVGLVALLAPVDIVPQSVIRGAARDTRLYPVHKVGGWLEPKNAAPTTYIIDRRGTVRFAGTGVMNVAALNDALMPVIREPQPPM